MEQSHDSADFGRLDELAEEFAARYRRGERPSLQEYVDRSPGMAEEIRVLFATVVEVEEAEGLARATAFRNRRRWRGKLTGPCGVPGMPNGGETKL